MTRNRRIAALLTLPLLFVLAGCFRLDLNVTLVSDTEAHVGMEFVDSMDFLGDDLDCDEMGLTDGLDGADAPELTTEEFEVDGHKGCRVSGTVNPQDWGEESGIVVALEGNNLVFIKPADAGGDEMMDFDDDMFDMFAPEVSISVTFPGPVVSANEDGTIDGNTVTWTGIQALSKELTATGSAGDDSPLADLFGAGSWTPPLALVIGLAAAFGLVIVGIVVVLARRGSSGQAA